MALPKNGFSFNLPTDTSGEEDSVRYIKVSVIDEDPENNQIYDKNEAALVALMNDIASIGLAQPITVRRHPMLSERYIVVAGHRRLESCKRLKWDKIPCIVKKAETDLDDIKLKVMMVTSNIMTREQSIEERARVAVKLKQLVKSYKAAGGKYKGEVDAIVGGMMGITASYVRQLIRLRNADPEIRDLIEKDKLTISEALKLTSMNSGEAAQIVSKVKEAKSENAIKEAKEPLKPQTAARPETQPEQPETQPEQPETQPEQPETQPEQPETQPEQPETQPETEAPKKPLFSNDVEKQKDHEEKIMKLLSDLDDSFNRLKDVLADNDFAPSIIRATTEIERLIESNLPEVKEI